MPFVIGLNFRSTSTFVTDGANETYVLTTDTYPTTRGGATFGISGGIVTGSADRDAGIDRRLAGVLYKSNSSAVAFTVRVDLNSTGDHDIRIALGDAGSAQAYEYAQIQDNTTPVITIDDTTGTATAHFDDATGTDLAAASWPGSNAAVRVTFGSTILSLLVGSPTAQSGFSTIAHLGITEVVAPTAGASLFRGRNVSFFDDEEVNRFAFWPAVAASNDVTLALTGVSATGNAGSLGVDRASSLTGNAATVSSGTLGPSLSASISGNAATASVGSVTTSRAVGLAGVSGSTSVGTLGSTRTVSISGNSATTAVGTLTPVVGVTVALTGVSATASVGSLSPSLSKALTGVSATSAVGTLTPSTGIFVTLTGVQATASAGVLSPSTSKGLTGNSATASVGTLTAERSVTITGVEATTTVGSLTTSRTVSLTGVEAVAAVGTLSILSGDALAVSKNVGSAILFTAHVGTGVLRTGDTRTMTLITTNVDVAEIVYQDVRTDS